MTMLFQQITDTENIRSAHENLQKRFYNKVQKRYNFIPGPDGERFDQLNADIEKNLERIQVRLKSEDFSFGPYSERLIPKGGGGNRTIGQFNLRDKIIYHAIYRVVAPAYDHIFSDSLVSYRKGLGAWDSVLKAMRMARRENGKYWLFRTDVRHYVEALDLHILREQLHGLFRTEPEVLRLFLSFLAQPRIVDGVQTLRDKGSPQGADLTTFFYNLYLKDFDHHMVNEGFRYSRYSDDIIVWARTQDEAMRARRAVEQFLKKMKLEIHPSKTFTAAPGEAYEYLGYAFRRLTFTISKKSLGRLTRWIRRGLRISLYETLMQRGLTGEESLRIIIQDFQNTRNTQRLMSWLRYFQRINDPRQLRAVDKMIRERILACLAQRFAQQNYKLASPRKLQKQGLHSLVSLYYRVNQGRPLPADIQRKLGDQILFSPGMQRARHR